MLLLFESAIRQLWSILNFLFVTALAYQAFFGYALTGLHKIITTNEGKKIKSVRRTRNQLSLEYTTSHGDIGNFCHWWKERWSSCRIVDSLVRFGAITTPMRYVRVSACIPLEVENWRLKKKVQWNPSMICYTVNVRLRQCIVNFDNGSYKMCKPNFGLADQQHVCENGSIRSQSCHYNGNV